MSPDGEKEIMMIVHCLFEQSGTFKNEFKKLGYEAYDYVEYVERRRHNHIHKAEGKSRQVRRSEIHPQYANRFIRQFLID